MARPMILIFIHALRRDDGLIVSHRPKHIAGFCTEIPVQQIFGDHSDDEDDDNRFVRSERPLKDTVHQVVVENSCLVVDRKVCIESSHHDDAGEEIADFEFHVYYTCEDSDDNSCGKSREDGENRIDVSGDERGSDGSSEREAAIHRQIREIEYFVCDIYAQSHDSVDHALFKYT